MYKIDSPGNVSGEFSNGNPAAGQRATQVDAGWLNELQAEIVNVITNAGLTLEKGNRAQLVAAIALLTSGVTVGDVVAALAGFTGDTGSGGMTGLVPAPPAGSAALGMLLGAGGSWVFPSALPHILVKDKRASGSDSSVFFAGQWQIAPLNTLEINAGGFATLGPNQITVAEGSYYAEWYSNAVNVDINRSRLRNVTAGETLADGSTHDTTDSPDSSAPSMGECAFTLTEPSVLRIEHRSQSNGYFGTASSASWGGFEVYRALKLWRIG